MREIALRLFHEIMPEGVHGMVAEDHGKYMVVINANESPDEQAKAFLHEMLHIYNDDFNLVADEGVQSIESRTHEQLARLLQSS